MAAGIEEIRRYLEERPEKLVVVVAHGGILEGLAGPPDVHGRGWIGHTRAPAGFVSGIHQARLVGQHRVLSMRFSRETGWLWLMTDIQHLQPDYFSSCRAVRGWQHPPQMSEPSTSARMRPTPSC